jgi:hypothetical protein
VVDDQVLVTRDWGFSPEDVQVPVVLWHGRADRTVLESEGHISLLVRHSQKLLAELAAGRG